MLAEKETGVPESSSDYGSDDDAVEKTVSGAPHKKPTGVPGHVRKLAREAAGRHGMTLGEFLSEAILAYADGKAEPDDHAPLGYAETLSHCELRIGELERRMRTLEIAAKQDRLMARKWLEKLVERPWLRNRNF